MDVEEETKLEYRVITIFLIIVSILVIILLIGLSSDLFEFEADSSALEISPVKGTDASITFKVTNTHDNDLKIKDILVDGIPCHACLSQNILEKSESQLVSCANLNNTGASYQKSLQITFGDRKNSYGVTTQKVVSGPVGIQLNAEPSLKPLFERQFKTLETNEIIFDATSNSCPQLSITGSNEYENKVFDLFYYTFSNDGLIQQQKEWNLNYFDTGISLNQNSYGKTFIFGNTYNQGQGSDSVLLTTDAFSDTFLETFKANALSDEAKALYVDPQNYKYTVTEIKGDSTKLLIEKIDTNTQIVWQKEIPLKEKTAFLTGAFSNGKLYIIVSSEIVGSSEVYVFSEIGTQERKERVRLIVQSMTFDAEGNAVLVGQAKNQATSDASIFVYHPNWVLKWSTTWGDVDNEVYNDVVVYGGETYYVVGSFEIERGFFRSFIHKYDTNGKLVDSYLFRAPQSLQVKQLELTNEGLYAIGEINDGKQNDIFIAKFT